MRLIRLDLLNFRQHAATAIEFRPGLTGIIGPNGAGKSTILEAIAWAIYGSAAARGTNDTIRFSRAPDRSRVEVGLEFELGGSEYRVVRTLTGAEVFMDGSQTPVASSVAGVGEYLRDLLPLSRDEFFSTYFTGQKELQFLAQMGAAQRGRFLSQVLGYDRLRIAQERTRVRRNELRHEIAGLRTGSPHPDTVWAERESAERRRNEAGSALQTAEAVLQDAEHTVAELEPRWGSIQAARERARELGHALELATGEREAAEREAGRARAELDEIVAAESERANLNDRLAPLSEVAEECRELERHARIAERRGALEERERALAGELDVRARSLEKLEQAPDLLEQYTRESGEAKRALAEAERAVETRATAWAQRRQETETKLQGYRDRAHELKEQARRLREAGADGVCPTCQRPLREELDRVVRKLDDEWETLVQDGKWLNQRLDQLRTKPAELRAGEARRTELREIAEDKARRLMRCEQAMHRLEEARTDRALKQEQVDALRRELAELPAGYDNTRHERMEARLLELRALEARANRFDEVVARRPAIERELAAAQAAIEAASGRCKLLEAELGSLGFREEHFAELREAQERAGHARRQAELRATEVRGELAAAEQALEAALRAEAEDAERRAALVRLELDLLHQNELDAAFTQLRSELNSRVRPELGELASGFLTELTDGRYTSLEIDENYDVMLLDDGRKKAVISGGEEDIANLVLRLAISQMIAGRAGVPLSVLVLDGVFGSLDIDRRHHVVQLLDRLRDRFEQVILISHLETIREGLDHVIRVDFDERSGASIVREETAEGAVA